MRRRKRERRVKLPDDKTKQSFRNGVELCARQEKHREKEDESEARGQLLPCGTATA